jgi:predicted enzyme related to lactoylglutathione lyase
MSTTRISIVAALFAASLAAQSPVTGVGNFSHIVANLDRAMEFYRDLIGLEMPAKPGAFSGNPAIMNLGNTAGAQSRFAALKVPGSALGVELIEYKDIDREPAQPLFHDPGAATLILSVRDIDTIVARVKKSAGRIQTLGGAPATIQAGSKTIFLQDPDGFFIELSQRTPAPETTAPATANVIGEVSKSWWRIPIRACACIRKLSASSHRPRRRSMATSF